MNEDNKKIVQQAYENFKNGDLPALLDLFSDDFDFRVPKIDNMPWFGSRKGREATAEFFQTLAKEQEALTFNPREYFTQGDRVVALGDYTWRATATGKEFGSDWAHVWIVKNDKLVGFQEYADTAANSKAHQTADGA